MKKVLATLVILLTAFIMVSCGKSKDQVKNAVNATIYTVNFESNGGTGSTSYWTYYGKACSWCDPDDKKIKGRK